MSNSLLLCGFTNSKRIFSIVILVYQRVPKNGRPGPFEKHGNIVFFWRQGTETSKLQSSREHWQSAAADNELRNASSSRPKSKSLNGVTAQISSQVVSSAKKAYVPTVFRHFPCVFHMFSILLSIISQDFPYCVLSFPYVPYAFHHVPMCPIWFSTKSTYSNRKQNCRKMTSPELENCSLRSTPGCWWMTCTDVRPSSCCSQAISEWLDDAPLGTPMTTLWTPPNP